MKAVFETRFQKVGETEQHYRAECIKGVDDAKLFAVKHLTGYFLDKRDAEEFLVITLDTQHRPIRIVRVTRGTLNASLVHPREVFRAAIADCAASVILAHNHPSGDPTPSQEDIATTSRLKQAGDIVGIRVLDHIVVGEYCVSLAERGSL